MDYARLGTAGVVGAMAAGALTLALGTFALPVLAGGALVGGAVDTISQANDAQDAGQPFNPIVPDSVTNTFGTGTSNILTLAVVGGAIYIAAKIIRKSIK